MIESESQKRDVVAGMAAVLSTTPAPAGLNPSDVPIVYVACAMKLYSEATRQVLAERRDGRAPPGPADERVELTEAGLEALGG